MISLEILTYIITGQSLYYGKLQLLIMLPW
jgi:hypothetical protein